jgi:hypothetical protein
LDKKGRLNKTEIQFIENQEEQTIS